MNYYLASDCVIFDYFVESNSMSLDKEVGSDVEIRIISQFRTYIHSYSAHMS